MFCIKTNSEKYYSKKQGLEKCLVKQFVSLALSISTKSLIAGMPPRSFGIASRGAFSRAV